MKFFYVTLNTNDEAKKISFELLEKRHAICTNWFPINCAYAWEGKIMEESEYVLIIKTIEGKRKDIEKVISENINYLNCIAELSVNSINEKYGNWLTSALK